MKTITNMTVVAALCCGAVLAQQKLALKDLPPAVQSAIQAELKGGEIKQIDKEKEHGVVQYEVAIASENAAEPGATAVGSPVAGAGFGSLV